ncbi:MAG: type I-G CRISPR-associated helicase/endonuclease Cas3g [Terriglobales bacterium]
MSSGALPSFEEFFTAAWESEHPLEGEHPFPWQIMLADRVLNGPWPQVLDLPTASGKTACMDVALYALAAQAALPMAERSAPRRIWFVVDRRLVVDQAFKRAGLLAEKLRQAKSGPLRAVAERLCELSGIDRPLAVGRLRGGALRDDGFVRRPTQPAIICSTVDQLGSWLLFRSYGGSGEVAPIHAGLAGNDSLIFLDEAHCSAPFLQTLRSVARYRSPAWSEQCVPTPFAFVSLSATPTAEAANVTVFPAAGEQRRAALDCPELIQRLGAPKPALLRTVPAARAAAPDPLVQAATLAAAEYVRTLGLTRVAVIVNRVAIAEEIEGAVRRALGPEAADVQLLTGRLRPVERDAITARLEPFLRAHKPEPPPRPLVTVATQCIEVGADFDFDGLVTECASLDALRQRFGRLNRLGRAQSTAASILCRESDLSEGADDPIYGGAICAAWRLLTTFATGPDTPTVDFGFAALDARLRELDPAEIAACLAPHRDAPILLPAHLDLLCQTSPRPAPDPDLAAFLHGKGRGAPEVQVLWRGDLDKDRSGDWVDAVALCPPLAGETVSVPLYRLRMWLECGAATDIDGDVEGGCELDDGAAKVAMRPCLAWRGRTKSAIITDAEDLRPGDTVVLPAEYGLAGLAQSAGGLDESMGVGAAGLDLWERANAAAGRPAALRISGRLWAPWSKIPAVRALITASEDEDTPIYDLRDLMRAVAEYSPAAPEDPAPLPAWIRAALQQLTSVIPQSLPGKGVLLRARAESDANADDLFADDDDLTSASADAVPLKQHTADVVRASQRMATRCLPQAFWEAVATAAEWHDGGKLDPRFQLLLYGGDEIAAGCGSALAKSAKVPRSPAQKLAARAATGLPAVFRHEMLSLPLAEHGALELSAEERAICLHLIATHHGFGRPFAPIENDPDPPDVIGEIGGGPIALTSGQRRSLLPAHHLGSGVTERFWTLTRRYGWWGLAYLEAILRLADWYASAHPQPQDEALEHHA